MINEPYVQMEIYFGWICRMIMCNEMKAHSYEKLLRYLDSRAFTYINPMDENRMIDGVDLRYRYGEYFGLIPIEVSSLFQDKPCTVLEMMVALAIRCEEHIMGNQDLGNRTGEWFWEMVKSLGIDGMDDEHFDKYKVSMAIDTFLDRKYSHDGEGGLFTVAGSTRDFRKAEIWFQLCWYLDSIA